MSRVARFAISAVASLLFCSSPGRAEDLSAKQLQIKDNAVPAKRQVKVQSIDAGVQLSEGGDPSVDGAMAHIYSATDDFCVYLPPGADWKGAPTSWKYKSKATKNSAFIGDGKLKLQVKSGVTFTLADNTTQGSVNVSLQFGSGTRYCMRCSTAIKDDASQFKAKDCAPAACDAEPSVCVPTGPTVQVTVDATEPLDNPLDYEWRTTDGSILSASGPEMTWVLPNGPGLHFAYVLVTNGKGGYTERRVAVSTDDIGTPLVIPPPIAWAAPAAPASIGNTYRSILRSGSYAPPLSLHTDGVYTSGAEAFLSIAGVPQSPTVTTDQRGHFLIPDVPDGTYDLQCRIDASQAFDVCATDIVMDGEAANDPYQGPTSGRSTGANGRLVLADGAPCGTGNEFFGRFSVGRATLRDIDNATLAGPFDLNEFGHYSFADDPAATSILLECEGAAPVSIPVSLDSTRTVLADTSSPVVTGMSAKLGNVEVGIFLPPPSGGPADAVPGADFFLTAKGIDSRMSACRYYVAVGAAASCDVDGNPVDSISFDDWKRQTHMDPYLQGGAQEAEATYVNRVDLNLTRDQHSVTYGPGQTPAYVCNYLGPKTEAQADVDAAIANARNGRNLVACVAMDNSVSPGVNGNQPFTRFLIFGGSGELLSSINLDGRREKFVPGVCVACHGGDHYAGRFSEVAFGSPGAGAANIGTHFLPYDTGNFSFSTAAGLTKADQEEAIYELNQNLLNSGPTPASQELIAGWYAGGHILDETYVPPSWAGTPPADHDFYTKVYARSCRTCHVNFTEALNFDHYANLSTSSSPTYEDGFTRTGISVCAGSVSWLRTHSMPNSLRTMELFWNSAGSANDQPAVMAAFIAGAWDDCTLDPSPNP